MLVPLRLPPLRAFFHLAAVLSASLAAQAQTSHIGDLKFGYTYLYADQGSGERSNIQGWFARPSVVISHGYSIFADFTNYYGANSKGSLNSHGFTLGVDKGFRQHATVRPSVFAEAGDIRNSNAGAITNSGAFLTGLGIGIPIKGRWSVALTPAEYALIDTRAGVRNDFNAKAGLSFAF